MSAEPEHLRRAPRPVTVAAIQMACGWDAAANIARAETLVREAARRGARIILLPELFETPYFCIEQDARHLNLATPAAENPAVRHFAAVARELGVVLPISFFERAGHAHFNSVAILDADGTNLGLYRKSHIPNGPGYQEKNYFAPGDTGFRVWDTRYARIGVGICWDQWFPESARCMCVMGADLLFYPTGIGSDCHDHWQITMQGHAAANLTPLVVSNRIGTEEGEFGKTTFWGRSFIAGPNGQIVAKAGRDREEVITATFDLEENREMRANWGVFRDRRPDLYWPLMTMDGRSPVPTRDARI